MEIQQTPQKITDYKQLKTQSSVLFLQMIQRIICCSLEQINSSSGLIPAVAKRPFECSDTLLIG